MAKGNRQALRKAQAMAMQAKWQPTLKHGNYNTVKAVDGVERIRKLNLDIRHKPK